MTDAGKCIPPSNVSNYCFRECQEKFGVNKFQQMWEVINQVFDVMPLAAVVDQKVPTLFVILLNFRVVQGSPTAGRVRPVKDLYLTHWQILQIKIISHKHYGEVIITSLPKRHSRRWFRSTINTNFIFGIILNDCRNTVSRPGPKLIRRCSSLHWDS